MNENDYGFNIGLPKWPQMVVCGNDVTIDQAKEILLRTDDFLTSDWSTGNSIGSVTRNYADSIGLVNNWELTEYVKAKVGFIETEYVSNNWASSSFIYGPHGWCGPTGQVYFMDNVGKWPSVSDIFDEWAMLAEAFPFLDLTATLYSGEQCEDDTVPLVTIHVKDGKVHSTEPFADPRFVPPTGRQCLSILAPNGDAGLPHEWYDEYAEKIKLIVAEYNAAKQ